MSDKNCPTTSEIAALINRETELLDDKKLAEWIALFSEKGTYWMPVTIDQADPLNHISIFYDDVLMMNVRKHNLEHARAPSKEVEIRSSRITSNIRLLDFDAGTRSMTVKCNFQAVLYYNVQTLFAGQYIYKFIWTGEKYLIEQKKVNLINCDASHGTIITYI